MKRSKFSEEQIVFALRQAEAGTPVGDLCRQLGVSNDTFYAWTCTSSRHSLKYRRRLKRGGGTIRSVGSLARSTT